jgi:proteasome lid subunit RPN8/RPN11
MSKTRAVQKTKSVQETKPVQRSLKLQIDNEVTRRIRQHARAHMKTEVCGVLIGEVCDNTVEVQASIKASSAAQAGTHVTFTQDAWEEIYRVKDETYPDHRIVGWYHSHPGFGVFLSEHDTFIHRNFFSSPNQVAWVYDPHTDEEGCFGWFDGEIERIAALSVIDLNGDGEERTPKNRVDFDPLAEESDAEQPRPASAGKPRNPPRWLKILVNTTMYLFVAILGFAACFFLFPSVVGIAIDPRTGGPLMMDGRPVLLGPIQMEHLLRQQPDQSAAPPQQAEPAPVPAPANDRSGGAK